MADVTPEAARAETPAWELPDDERDALFASVNNSLWGKGNWIRCPRCFDGHGREAYHHKDAHT